MAACACVAAVSGTLAVYKKIVFCRAHIELHAKDSIIPTRFINPLFLVLVTASRGYLAKQIQSLKAENEVFRAQLEQSQFNCSGC